jgi:hypothetical protein
MVITNNGKPQALILNIAEGELEELRRSVRQARAVRAFNNIRMEAAERGFLSEEEINAEIAAYRKERREASER